MGLGGKRSQAHPELDGGLDVVGGVATAADRATVAGGAEVEEEDDLLGSGRPWTRQSTERLATMVRIFWAPPGGSGRLWSTAMARTRRGSARAATGPKERERGERNGDRVRSRATQRCSYPLRNSL